MKQHRVPPIRVPLLPSERAALSQAHAVLANAVPQIRDVALRNSLHGALCQAERALGREDATPLRAERREGKP